jgi:hypothetical protein
MKLKTWLAPSVVRHFPSTPAPRTSLQRLEAARNEQFSFQAAIRGDTVGFVTAEATGPAGWSVRVRRVGFVPVRHHNTPVNGDPLDVEGLDQIPGYVPDPLFDENKALLPADETHAFWITVIPGPDAAPGRHTVTVTLAHEKGKPVTHRLAVTLHGLLIAPRKDFDITHWFYADALIDQYKTDLFDKRFWEILARYIRNVAGHGQNTLYVPVFTPPLDGVKTPSQLLRVRRAGKDRYAFDWSDVRRYIRLAAAEGITRFEWCHPFTQWGVRHAIRIYEGQGKDEKLLWPADTGATSPTYRAFLSQYLPALRRFLQAEGILDKTFFHVSDEPHGDEALANYKAARALLKELAPWMTVMDALSDIRFAHEKLTDMPIPSIGTALGFVNEKIPCWCYYCCGPRGPFLNRLMDTPLAKIAMHGFLFYRWPFKGFLHWGYNYWYESQTRNLIDPFSCQDGMRWPGWAYGDTFVVYPGPDGPIDSMRWEIFGESLQDYALLQTLGVERDDRRLALLKSFEAFPKDAAWRQKTKAALYRLGGKA